jgi:phthalate 4,5-dioxygenase oxygenase subunit
MLSEADNMLVTRTDSGTPMGEYMRRFWMPALMSSEVLEPDSAPVRIRLMGEDLVAFRDTEGRVGLVDAYCAHRGAPLFFGRNEECGIRCIYHGWKYDVDGNCVDMPNEPPTSRFKTHVQLKSYPTREAGEVVWAYLGPGEPPAELPDLEWLRVPSDHVYIRKYVVESNYLQALEGDHDSSHASFLHSAMDGQIVGERPVGNAEIRRFHMKDKAPKLHVLNTAYGIITGARRNGSEGRYLWRIVSWLKPFYSLIASEPGTPLLLNVRVPRDDETSWFYRVSYQPDRPLTEELRRSYDEDLVMFSELVDGGPQAKENLDNDYLIDREIQKTKTFSGIRSIPAQDRAVSERMAPTKGFPGIGDRSRERLAASDAAIVQIRKDLLRGVRSMDEGVAPPETATPEIYFVRSVAIELGEGVPFDVGAARYISGEIWE